MNSRKKDEINLVWILLVQFLVGQSTTCPILSSFLERMRYKLYVPHGSNRLEVEVILAPCLYFCVIQIIYSAKTPSLISGIYYKDCGSFELTMFPNK